MTDQLQKDLDNATSKRFETQAAIGKQRVKAEQNLDKASIMAQKNFTKNTDKVEAKAMNRDPITGSVGSHPVGTGLGTTGGAVAGAALGALAGPIGIAIGGVVGAIVGAAAGHTAGESINPTAEESYWRDAFVTEPYFNVTHSFDDYAPAYRAGYMYRSAYGKRTWAEAETELEANWESNRGSSRLDWSDAHDAVRAAWDRAGVVKH